MKLLFVGYLERLQVFQKTLAQENSFSITHCTDGRSAIADLGQPGRHYDWIIMDGNAISEEEMDYLYFLRAMGPNIKSGASTCGASQPPLSPAQNTAGCNVDWDKNGVLQLNCTMHKLMQCQTQSSAKNKILNDGFVFDFHRPCRNSR